MVNSSDDSLSHPQYWEAYYIRGPGHEWLQSFVQLEPFFEARLFSMPGVQVEDQPKILHLGSGDSTIPRELLNRGYEQQVCIDFSETIVKQMSEQHKGIKWQHMDVRDMLGIDGKSIDAAFDKSMLDVMIHGSPWNPPDDVLRNTHRYLREVHRVLKDSGVFLCISYRQPHFISIILDGVDLWEHQVDVLGGEGSFGYFGFVLRKRNETTVE